MLSHFGLEKFLAECIDELVELLQVEDNLVFVHAFAFSGGFVLNRILITG